MIATNWYVITGGPSSGKTTLINQLAGVGYPTAPEIAREFIQQFLAEHSFNDLRHDAHKLQRGILAIALKREKNLKKEQLIFFDRGTPDSLGYFQYYQINAHHVEKSCQYKRYKKIFYCQQLPLVDDRLRVESDQSAKMIGACIRGAYIKLGYELVEIPAVTVEERLALIVRNIEKDGCEM